MIQTIKFKDIDLIIDYDYYFCPGVMYSPDASGMPDVEKLDINSIHSDGNICSLLDYCSRTVTIYADIKEKLLPSARDSFKN